jgi:hypothetical protein
VSPFIVLAKEQADQEQQARSQQRHQQFGVQQLSEMYSAAAMPPLMMLPNGSVVQQPQLQQNPQPTAMQLTDLCACNPHQQQPAVTIMASASPGLSQYPDAAGFNTANGIVESLHTHPQQHWLPQAQPTSFAPNQDALQAMLTQSPISQGMTHGPYLMLSTPSFMDINHSAASSSSTAMSAGSNISSNGNGALLLSKMISPGTPNITMGSITASASPGARAAGILTPQHLDAAAVASFPALAAQLHQQQAQAVPLLLQQVAASNAAPALPHNQGLAIPAGCALPLQQQQLLFLTNSQPLQLSVQPQVTTVAGHLSAHHQQTLQQAQQPYVLVQHQPQQQQQQVQFVGLGLPAVSLEPQPVMSPNPSPLSTSSQTAAALVGHSTSASTAEQLPRVKGPPLSLLPASANVGLGVNGGMACTSTDSFVEDMLHGLGYTSAMLSAGTASVPQQQQLTGPVLHHHQLMANGVVVAVNRDCLAVNGMVECSSSAQSCSSRLAASACTALPVNASAPMATGGAGTGTAPPAGCSMMPRTAALVNTAHGPAAGAAASPTFSSSSGGSSSSKSFGLRGRLAC